jgi:NAD(P)-dependent dehydrogenase (short-subunit alcohol dehydrogenase family)
MEKLGAGSIVNSSSGAGIAGFTAAGTYCSSKGAVRLMIKSMALVCAKHKSNIRVNSIHSAPFSRPCWNRAWMIWVVMKCVI